MEHGKVTETSSVPELLRSEDSTLDELVNQGRDSLFDEELHYELVKEGRQLIAYGVGVASGTITIAVPAPEVMNVPRMLLIDLVDREESIFAQGMLAPAVGQYLKLGLNHIYRQRYRRRTTVPTPLSKKRSAEPQGSTLLQSILCLAQHRQAVLGLQGPLKHLNASMLSAGLDSTYETDGLFAISPQVSSKQRANKRVQKDAVDSLFSNTLGEQSSTCSLGLPSSQRLLVHVHTDLSGPLYGTKYNIERVSPTTGIEPVARDVDNGAQAMKTLYEAVPRFILQHLAAQETAWSLHRSAPELSNVKDPRKRVSLLVSKGAIGLVTEVEGPEAKACIRCTWDGEHIDVAVKDGFDKLQSILSEIVESHEP